MKKIFILSVVFAFVLVACDKIDKPYPVYETELDISLYPGNWSDYTFPIFAANTNTLKNVLIEDFTGHKCTFCPAAAKTAHDIETTNEGRVFVSTIHTGPTGKEAFQSTSPASSSSADFSFDFTTPQGLEIGKFFGSIPSGGFSGNPKGVVSRRQFGGSEYAHNHNQWTGYTNTILNENLVVNLQAKVNYFPQTRGAFVHIEADILAELDTAKLGLVVAFHEDSIIKPQLYPGGTTGPTMYKGADTAYVHHDRLIDHVYGAMSGASFTASKRAENGKYYFDYSYKVGVAYKTSNSHFLIYVWDRATFEVYQVIKVKIE